MPVYTNPTIDQEISPKQIFYVDDKCAIFTCNGSPEGIILANTGSIALSDNGSVYKKTTDLVNTGWIELQSGSIASPATITGTNPTLNFVDTDVGDDDAVISLQSDVLSISISGGTPIQLRSNGQILGIAKRIQLDVTTVGNVGAGLDPLHSFTLPANSLAANGDCILIKYGGNVAANDNDKHFVARAGGTSFIDTGLVDLDAVVGWYADALVIRLSSTSIRVVSLWAANAAGVTSASAAVTSGGAGGFTWARQVDITGLADLSTNTLLFETLGEGTSNNDIIQNISSYWLTQF